jgi:hypothetical protein
MLTFEWILVITLLGVGVIGGIAAIRNTIICEYSGLVTCIGAVDVTRCLEGPSACPLATPSSQQSAWWCSSCNR